MITKIAAKTMSHKLPFCRGAKKQNEGKRRLTSQNADERKVGYV
jgi:hypothetical protein